MDFQMFASLPASDIERARSWYEETLGAKPATIVEDGSLIYMQGDSGFMVYASEFAGTNKATAAGLAVRDFDAAVTELRGKGVVFEEYDFGDELRTVDGIATAPDGTRAAWFKDSEGNILALSEDPRT